MLAAPHEIDEAPRPRVAGDVAQVRVGREQVLVHDAVVPPVDAAL